MKVKTEKNFLNQDDFNKLRSAALVAPFYFYGYVSNSKNRDGYYFTHDIFTNSKIFSSDIFELMAPVFKKLEMKALYKAKINLYPSTHKILQHDQHVDSLFKCKAFILSLNTCDGFTKVGKNIKIPSVENQGIFFDSDVPHNSTTCTDQDIRLNININYF